MNITATNTAQTLDAILTKDQKRELINLKGQSLFFTCAIQNQDATNNLIVSLRGTAASGEFIIPNGNGVLIISFAKFTDVSLITSSGTISTALLFKPITDGEFKVVNSASSGLPSGAATAANQATGNTSIGNVDTNLGAKADTSAADDTGSYSLIALTKRALARLTTLIGTITTAGGSITGVTNMQVGGTVTTSNPVYSASTVNPLSLDAAGRLRTRVEGVVGNGSAVAGNPVVAAGSDGSAVRNLKTDTSGRLLSSSDFSYVNINTNTTTLVKTGAGVLHSITINTKGASSNTITLWDNTSAAGTKIGTIDSTAQVQTLIFDAKLTLGLFVVTATGTAPDITVTYL